MYALQIKPYDHFKCVSPLGCEGLKSKLEGIPLQPACCTRPIIKYTTATRT